MLLQIREAGRDEGGPLRVAGIPSQKGPGRRQTFPGPTGQDETADPRRLVTGSAGFISSTDTASGCFAEQARVSEITATSTRMERVVIGLPRRTGTQDTSHWPEHVMGI